MAAAHGCSVAADSRRRKPQRALVDGEPVFIHRRKDGAQGWCGRGVSVLGEEPKPGRNDTVGTHAELLAQVQSHTAETRDRRSGRNRGLLHRCYRDWLKQLVKDARDTSPTSLTRVTLRTTSWTFAWEDQIRSRNLSSTHLPIPTPHHAEPDQKPHVEPEAEVSTSIGTDMETGASDRRVRVREEGTDSPRRHVDAPPDRESMVEPRWKTPRRAEASEYGEPFRSAEASSSELPQASAAAAGDTTTGEGAFMRLPDNDAARSIPTVDPDGRRKNDDH